MDSARPGELAAASDVGALVAVVALAILPRTAPAAEPDQISLLNDHLAMTAEISSLAIRARVGDFVLIRSGRKSCAVRIVDAWRDDFNRPSSAFTSGGYVFSARYESYFRNDGRIDLTSPGVRQNTGVLVRSPERGFGRMVIPSATARPACGGIRVRWSNPTWLWFSPDDVEMAITQIRDPKLVDFAAPALQWFRRDDNRPNRLISEDAATADRHEGS